MVQSFKLSSCNSTISKVHVSTIVLVHSTIIKQFISYVYGSAVSRAIRDW